MTTLMHTMTETVRHPAATSRDCPRRIFYALRALTERREGNRYRATFGAAAFRPQDLDASWNDPTCAFSKRPRPQR